MLAGAFAALPLFTMRSDLLNLGVQIFLAVVLAESWNLLGGYAGQINLGHAAFFGLGALVTRTLWVGGTPLILALFPGALVAMLFGLIIGVPAFRLRGAYFAIGTLGLAEILRITIGNLLPQISTIPAAELTSYNILPRYYLTLAIAMVSVGVVAWLVPSRLGLGIRAVREDEAAAEATGVSALRHKLLALALSTALAGLAGGAFAYTSQLLPAAHFFSSVDFRRRADVLYRRCRHRPRTSIGRAFLCDLKRGAGRAMGRVSPDHIRRAFYAGRAFLSRRAG
jgi:ABC-type branched-chain amino acid transport system, permease component